MSERCKFIVKLATENCSRGIPGLCEQNNKNRIEKGTELTSTTLILPRPVLLSDFPNILDVDKITPELTAENSEVLEDPSCPSSIPPMEMDENINSVTSSPPPSLPPELAYILNSDDSCADKDYMPEGSGTDSSDDNSSLLLLQRKIKVLKNYHSDANNEGIVQEQAVQVSPNSDEVGSSQLTQNHITEVPVEKPVKKWSRVVRKERTKKMHSGQSYIGVNGRVVNARELKPSKQCRKKCTMFFSDDVRKKIFDEYWSLGTRDKRVAFIANLINSKEPQVSRKRKRDSLKKRNITYDYFLEVNGKRVSVCKDCFCRILDEKEKFIKIVLKNKMQSTSGITLDDQRGKRPSANKKTEQELNEVRAHIKSFPSHESHYTRRVNDKRYLPSHLNLRIMYDLYKEGRENPVGRTIYEREFHNLKLSFKKPYVDTCYKCDTLNMQIQVASRSNNIEDKRLAERELQLHQEQANAAYGAKKVDKEKARNNPQMKCFTFDLQQCLPTPFIASSVAFYKRQLWTYNLTIHDNATGESIHYMWHEALAARGGNEIASCLYRHIKDLPDTINEVSFYSDTCGGQNKNSHVAAMFIKAQSENPQLTINHKFLTAGHTHMECDVDHSMIEKHKKKMEIPVYHPHDWYRLVRTTGRKKQFKVHEMQQEEFLDFSGLLKSVLVYRKKNLSGEQFLWHSIQWLQYKDNGLVNYKTSLNRAEDFKIISFLRRGKNYTLKCVPVERKYTKGLLPISKEKKNDLCSLLCLVPPVFHEFYKNLPTSSNVIDNDPDLIEEDEEN